MTRAWLLLAALLPLTASAQLRLLVIPSYGDPPYQSVVAGIRGAVPEARVDSQTLPSNRAALEQLVQGVPPDTVLVPLGAAATEAIAELNPPHPVVACFLLGAAPARHAPRWLVATLEIPPDIQASWLRKVLPGAKAVGVVYNPAESAAKAEALSAALRRAGFQVLPAEAERSADIDEALARLRDGADVLVGIPDPTVFNPIAAKTMMLFSYRQRIPVIGLSQYWTRAGALYSIEWEPADHGRYCAQLAQRAAGENVRVEPTRRLRTSVNLRAAAHMHLTLAPDLLASFTKVFD